MLRLTFSLIFLIAVPLTGNTQDNYRIPENVKRILFLGNSITYKGQYVAYIEAYLALRYPEKQFEFINVGLPSETVSGLSEPNHADGRFARPDLHERLKRILQQTKPDLVFACYGMNDGIYLPFDESRFQKFKQGINWLHNQVSKSGAAIIHLAPPLFDKPNGQAYANVLAIYTEWLVSCRYTKQWNVIDIHWPMKKHLENKRQVDANFVYAPDGVHPNETGHWMMAKQILLFLGESQVAKYEDAVSSISEFPNGASVLKLIEERQTILKDAWLTAIGHKRPEMKIGLPLQEAQQKANEITLQLQRLLVNHKTK